jgi:FtsP/CotA-like multicopper oxidase with cupredoxin domain
MQRRCFLRQAAATAAWATTCPLIGLGGAFAATGEKLRALPEFKSRDGHLKTELVMEMRRHRVGNRMLHVPAYNGSVPGPTIRLKPGDRLEWELHNKMVPTGIPDGATPDEIAAFNKLEYTNVHTHGLQVSPKEGHDYIYGTLQPDQPPLKYSYDIADKASGREQPAGMCWYHPHFHGSTTHQAWQGLAGAIVIEGDIDKVDEVKIAKERVIVMNALLVNPDGEVPRALIAPNAGFSPFTSVPSMPTDIILTLNGQLQPVIDIRPGETQRWRVLAAAPHRFYWLELDGHDFYQIGQDGVPFAEARPVKRILMAPGNRAEFIVKGGKQGSYPLRAVAYEQGHPGGMRPQWLLGTVVVSGDRKDDPLPGKLVTPPQMPDLPVSCRRTVQFKGEISGNDPAQEGHAGHGGTTEAAASGAVTYPPVQFYLDGKVFDIDRIDQNVVAGTVEEWDLVNLDVFQHPFHIHVNPFQVVAMNGQPVDDPTWWDVIALPSKGTLTIRTFFRPDIDGKTVYHCHILPHEDNGMMANVMINPKGTVLPGGECET